MTRSFAQRVPWLARARRESGTASALSTDDIIEASERLACISLLSGSEAIDYGPEASPSDLSVDRLGGLPSGSARPLDRELLRTVRLSGLAEAESPEDPAPHPP
jgi:hypothetical protein